MSMRPISDVRSGLNTLVDTQIGNAFPVVRKVYEHIDEIEYVAAVYATGRSRDISLRLSHTRELVEWQYTGDPEWTVLFKFSDLLGGDMVNVIEAQRLLGIQLAALQDTLTADAAIAVEAKNSALSSKVAAKASEDAAKVSELSIGTAAISANASKVAAAASATAADTSANRADTRATAAAASAASASLQSVNVGTLVNTAIGKAGEATTAAQTATTKAAEASTSAQDAAVSAAASSDSAQISINASNSASAVADLAIVAVNKSQEAIAAADKAKDWATLIGSEVENGFGYSAKQYAASAAASANTTAGIAEEIQGSIANASAFAETARLSAVAAEASATATAGNAVLTAADVVSSAANALAAETSANTIGNSAAEAAASALLAEKWADSDIEVEGGKFSAKYWASQAQSSTTGAITYRGNHSALAGNFPPTAVLGDFYRISAEGTIDGTLFRVKDAIVYNGTEWSIIGQSDVVYTVAGRKGNVVLTAADVGLDQADNTADADKPVSTAQQTALDLKSNLDGPAFTGVPVAPTADVGTNTTQLATTAFVGAEIASEAAPISHMTDDGTGHSVVSATQAGFMSVADKAKLDGLPSVIEGTGVESVAGRKGDVVLVANDVGLGNVNNTSDSAKPISTAQQTALDQKANIANPTFSGVVSGISKTMVGLGNVDNTSDVNKPVSAAMNTALGLKAPTESPVFTGVVSGVSKAMVGLGSVDNTADVDKPVSTAQLAALNQKASLASPTFTGTVGGITKAMVGLGSVENTADSMKSVASAASTPWLGITGKPSVIASGIDAAAARTSIGAGTSNLVIGTTASTAKAGNYAPAVADVTGLSAALATKVDVVAGKKLTTEDFSSAEKTKLAGIATGAQVNVVPTVATVTGLTAELAAKAPLASPSFTGSPNAPTPTYGTNSTQLATMAAVQAAIAPKQDILTQATAMEMMAGTSNTARSMSPLNIKQAFDGQKPIRVVIVGDSLMSQDPAMPVGAGGILEAWLKSSVSAEVINMSIAGLSFYQSNTVPKYGTKTMRERVIELNPDVVVVSLGLNDIMHTGDGPRTLTQVKTDALNFFSALRLGLPNAKIIFGGQTVSHGVTNVSSLTNDKVIPAFQTLQTSGLLWGLNCPDILLNAVDASTKTKMTNMRSFVTYVNGLSYLTSNFVMDTFAIHRVGCGGVDRLHMRPIGQAMMIGYIIEHFLSAGTIAGLREINWNVGKTSALISAFFVEYDTQLFLFLSAHNHNCLPVDKWFMGYAHNVQYTSQARKTNTLANPSNSFWYLLSDFPPFAKIQASINEADWIDFGYADGSGSNSLIINASDIGGFGFNMGANTIRFRTVTPAGHVCTGALPVNVT